MIVISFHVEKINTTQKYIYGGIKLFIITPRIQRYIPMEIKYV